MGISGKATDQRVESEHARARMQLTVLFVDVCGSTVLSGLLELEHYDQLLERFFAICKAAALGHGGNLTRGEGDGAIIAFGLTKALEDQGRRAVETALDIREAFSSLGPSDVAADFPSSAFPIALRAGIHGGIVLVASGRENRDATDLVGEVANIAKKLADAAGHGGTLASHSVLGPYAHFFDYVEARRDGLSTLPKACQIAGRRDTKRRFDAYAQRGLSPLTGRDAAFGGLRKFVCGESAAQNRCVVVVGDAGYGKTRLLEELCALPQRGKRLILRGSCESYLAAEVLQPFLHMLATLPIEFRGQGPVVRVEDFIVLFKALADGPETLLVIDDWQWADDASRQLIEAVLQMPGGPSVLLAARRHETNADWIFGAPHVELSAMSKAECASIVRAWLPEATTFEGRDILR